MSECPLGGECRQRCEDTCQGWADRAQVIADGQEQPVADTDAA